MGKLFGTDGIRGVANEHPMTAEMALNVGRAVAQFFRKDHTSPKSLSEKAPGYPGICWNPPWWQVSAQWRDDKFLQKKGSVLHLDIAIFIAYITSPNSYMLMKSPMTISCILSNSEKQIVFLARRFIPVRRVRCLLSAF